MLTLAKFARKKGARDKKKRRRRLLRNIAMGLGVSALAARSLYLNKNNISKIFKNNKSSVNAKPPQKIPDPVVTTAAKSEQIVQANKFLMPGKARVLKNETKPINNGVIVANPGKDVKLLAQSKRIRKRNNTEQVSNGVIVSGKISGNTRRMKIERDIDEFMGVKPSSGGNWKTYNREARKIRNLSEDISWDKPIRLRDSKGNVYPSYWNEYDYPSLIGSNIKQANDSLMRERNRIRSLLPEAKKETVYAKHQYQVGSNVEPGLLRRYYREQAKKTIQAMKDAGYDFKEARYR